MLEAKKDADAIHHRGLTGCDTDPGPQGIGIVRKIMSIDNMYVYSVFHSLVASLLCVCVYGSKSS